MTTRLRFSLWAWLLLILLVGQMIGWLALSRAMPFFAWGSSTSWGAGAPLVLRSATTYGPNGSINTELLRIDLKAMRWQIVPPSLHSEAYEELDVPKRPAYWRVDWETVKEGMPCTVEYVDAATGRVLRSRVLSHPGSLIDYRYAVRTEGILHWLDLDDPDSQWQAVEAIGDTSNAVWATPRGPHMVLQRNVLTNTNNPPAKQLIPVDLLLFSADRPPQVVASWDVMNAGKFFYLCDVGDTVAYVNSTGTHLEFRSKSDGAVVASEVIPERVFLTETHWNQQDKIVSFETREGHLNYDLLQRVWVEGPEHGRLILQQSKTGLQVFDCAGRLCLYDSRKQQVLREFDKDSQVHFLDQSQDTIVVMDERSLVKFNYYSAIDGRYVQTYAPFHVVLVWLACCLVAYGIWAVFWMRASLHLGWWAWLDIMLVVGAPMLIFSWRCASVGPAWDISRLPYQYLAGCCTAILAMSSLWLVFGKVRWLLRLLPIFVCEAIILVLCRFVFGPQIELLWRGMFVINLPVVGLLLSFLLLRLAKWQWVPPKSPRTAETYQGPTRIGDLFLLTVGVAIVVAAAGTSVSLFDRSKLALFWSDAVAGSIGVGMVSCNMLGSLSPRRWLFGIGGFLTIVLTTVLAIEPLTRWPLSQRIENFLPFSTELRVILTAMMACFIVALPYRLRGYRLGRAGLMMEPRSR